MFVNGYGFAKASAVVVVHGNRYSSALTETVTSIKQEGGKAFGVIADLSQDEDIISLVEKSKQVCGEIDILILNASIQAYATIEEFCGKEFEDEYRVNLKASFELIKAGDTH